jgi:peptide/nickel transport system permease protein
MLPVVTLLALNAGSLFSGALTVETVFARLGVGRLIYDAILGSDYNLALAALLLATFTTLLFNLAADLAYTRLDPRIAGPGGHG